MRRSVTIAQGPDFAIGAVGCRDDHHRWSAAEVHDGYDLVLVRRGRFRRLTAGVAGDVDPTVGYVSHPGEEQRFAHPAGGDACTWIRLSPRLWHSMAGQGSPHQVYVTAEVDLTHRRALSAAASGDPGYALAEQLVALLAATIRLATAPPGEQRDHALVGAARAAITSDHPAASGLLPLADLLGVSPYRLSRAFPRHLGVSLTRYRNRVRVGRALDRLEAGQHNLATLAADLGFADQAHLCRTIRDHLGHTPTAVRHLLAGRTLAT